MLLQEPQPAALLALERHGLGRALLNGPSGLTRRGRRPELAREHPPGWPYLSVTFGVSRSSSNARSRSARRMPAPTSSRSPPASHGDRKPIAAKLDELAFPADDREIVAHSADSAHGSPTCSRATWTVRPTMPRSGARCAGSRPRPSRSPAPTTSEAAAAARRWLEDVRHRRLAITGDDIVAAGLYGPAVGEALDAAMVAMLHGRADTREEQLAAALG